MVYMKKLALRVSLAVLFVGAVCAQIQIPETSAGRLFAAWLNAINGGGPATVEQFIGKIMEGRHAQSGGAGPHPNRGVYLCKMGTTTATHPAELGPQVRP